MVDSLIGSSDRRSGPGDPRPVRDPHKTPIGAGLEVLSRGLARRCRPYLGSAPLRSPCPGQAPVHARQVRFASAIARPGDASNLLILSRSPGRSWRTMPPCSGYKRSANLEKGCGRVRPEQDVVRDCACPNTRPQRLYRPARTALLNAGQAMAGQAMNDGVLPRTARSPQPQ